MNILITGNLSSLATTFAQELSKEKNKIILVAEDVKKLNESLPKNISTLSIDPGETVAVDVLAAYKFDVAIYIATREEQFHDGADSGDGQQLDGLVNTLEICKGSRIKNMVFISSTEVYGDMDFALEEETPQPKSINGYALYAGEQYCNLYREKYGLNVTIVRVPYIYGPEETASLTHYLIHQANTESEFIFPAGGERQFSIIHSNDVVDFIKRLISEDYRNENWIINLSSSRSIEFFELGNLLNERFPDVNIKFMENGMIYTRPVQVQTAKTVFDWVDLHDFQNDFPDIVKSSLEKPKPHVTELRKWWRRLIEAPDIIKWVELFLGAILMQFLSEVTGTLIQFKYVDFRLLFVIIMGLVYGMRFGIFAATLASLSILYTWYTLSFDWALLVHNVGNWFPFVVYFTAGLLVGYRRDKYESDFDYEKKQTKLIYEKYSFLYGVFQDIRALKDEFREQLVGYRDSFGRIFAITRELDSLEEDIVFIKALNILQEIMENENIAIYTITGHKGFARLEVNSPILNDRISKSLNLHDYPVVYEKISQGLLFQNTTFYEDYPAYVAPIMNGNAPVALVVIWHATYDQFSLDYANLFKVISGLIQASLVRASMFINANLDKMYLPSTRILNPTAFQEAIRIRTEMKKNRIADFQLLKLELTGHNDQDIYAMVSSKIRANDIIGTHTDGNYYIMLSQADKRMVNDIIDRLGNLPGKRTLIDVKDIN
jgi:UDP-glucose 4-epimerase